METFLYDAANYLANNGLNGYHLHELPAQIQSHIIPLDDTDLELRTSEEHFIELNPDKRDVSNQCTAGEELIENKPPETRVERRTTTKSELRGDRPKKSSGPARGIRYILYSTQKLTSIRKRIDRKKRDKGNNMYGRRGTLACGQCRKRNWKCVYSHVWTICEFCRNRNITVPCVKMPGPNAAAAQPVPSTLIATPIDASIKAEDVLLLQYAYKEECGSPRTRAFIRQIAVTYGMAIQCLSLRHAALAYTACLLPGFRERSEIHSGMATQILMRKLDNPWDIEEGDVFAASLLMWTLSIQNRRNDAVVHANGVMHMVERRWACSDASDMFRVFGPLVFGDATFFVSLGLDSYFKFLTDSQVRRISFRERLDYHRQIIHAGGSAIVWVDKTLLSITVSLWDVKRRLLSYLSDVAMEGPYSARRWRYQEAVQYVMADLDDPDFIEAFSSLKLPDPSPFKKWTVTEEVTNYMMIRMRSVQLLNIMLNAPTILQGALSPQASSIAWGQLSAGRSRRVPMEGEVFCYTWGMSIDLGLAGLVFCAGRIAEGKSLSVTFAYVKDVCGSLRNSKLGV